MTELPDVPTEAAVDECVAQVVGVLLTRRAAMARELAEHVIELMPELRTPEVAELVHRSTAANLPAFLDHLARRVPAGVIETSAELRGYTHAFVRSGLPLDSVLRGYRLVASDLIAMWTDAVARQGSPSPVTIGAVKRGTTFNLEWLDVICEQLALEYRAEAERLAEQRSKARLDLVGQVLGDPDLSDATASRRLGFALAGSHRGLVVRDCSEEPSAASLSAALRALTASMEVRNQFSVQADDRTLWCWVRWPLSGPPPDPPKVAPHVLVSFGVPSAGLEGFRDSHRQAVDAMRLAVLTDIAPGQAIDHGDVELAVLCTGDGIARARAFVGSALGALAADDKRAEKARDTLAAFYSERSNFRATAARLGVHHNTIRYRIEQAERLLGHPVDEGRLRVEIALHLAGIVGRAAS